MTFALVIKISLDHAKSVARKLKANLLHTPLSCTSFRVAQINVLLPTLWPKKSLPDGCGKNRASGQPVWHPVVVVVVLGVASVVQSVALSRSLFITLACLARNREQVNNHINFFR